MRLQLIAAASAAVVAASLAFAATLPQEPEKQTELHEQMQRQAGEWTGTITVQTPAGAQEMPATETVEAFGEHWVMTHFTCSMGPEMTYHGRGTFGYDARNEKLVGTWVDNGTSYMAVMEGEVDEDTGHHVMTWDAPSSADPGKIVAHKSITKHSDGAYTMEFHEMMGDEFVPTMTMDMKRKDG